MKPKKRRIPQTPTPRKKSSPRKGSKKSPVEEPAVATPMESIQGGGAPQTSSDTAADPETVAAAAAALQERYGSWYPVFTDEFDEEDAEAMHHEFLLATDQIPGGDTYSGIARFVGPYRGRQPEEVVLELWGEAAAYIQTRRWHPTEKVEVKSDGVLEYRVTIAPCRAMTRFVKRLAPDFRVKSPIGFWHLIIDHYKAMVEEREARTRAYDEEKRRRERN
jgi:hypothetical protein